MCVQFVTETTNLHYAQFTEVLPACFWMDGFSVIAGALPEVTENNPDGSLTAQEGSSGDAIVSRLSEGMATHLALQFRNPFNQTFAFTNSQSLMLEVSQYTFDGLSGFTAGNTPGFSIAQIKAIGYCYKNLSPVHNIFNLSKV